jgi:superfamily II DNA helicase RecQ
LKLLFFISGDDLTKDRKANAQDAAPVLSLAPAPVPEPLRNPTPSLTDSEQDAAASIVRRLYGQHARPTSLQQLQAIHIATSLRVDLLFTSPTGSGKTAIILAIPIAHPDLTTVAIVPFRVLVAQLVNTAHAHGITATTWPVQQGDDRPQLLVVSAEDIEHQHLRGYISWLYHDKVLAALVVDEVHTFALDQRYRPKLRKLADVRVVAVPVVALTATFPPPLEAWLAQQLAAPLTTIRLPSTRDNIQVELFEKQTMNGIIEFHVFYLTCRSTFDSSDRAVWPKRR